MTELLLAAAGGLAILLGGLHLGRLWGHAQAAEEEAERAAALVALGAPKQAEASGYLVRDQLTACPMCGGKQGPHVECKACQPDKRVPFCRHEEGGHLHCTCSVCRFEWLLIKQ